MRTLCHVCRQCQQSLVRLAAGGSSTVVVEVEALAIALAVALVVAVGEGAGDQEDITDGEWESRDGSPGRGHVVSFE